MAINYAYLAEKYIKGAHFTMHDRTYEGLEWHGPGPKPGAGHFEALQELENQEARREARAEDKQASYMEEVQRQARARAKESARPLEEKLRQIEQEEHDQCLKLEKTAIEIQSCLRARESALSCWREISAAQALINEEAQKYLEETAHYLAWEPGSIPAEIIEKRKMAQMRLSDGQLVYADWSSLRSKEMPAREELQEAIRRGGEHLERMQKICKEVALKYPKPTKHHY